MYHYNTAIRALVSDKPPVEIVLLACVIFWALEKFSGSGQAAFDHMKAAIKILGEWKSRRRPDDPPNHMIFKYVEPSIRDGVKFASRSRVEELAGQLNALSLSTRDVRIMNIDHPLFNSLEDAGDYLGDCINTILNLTSQTDTTARALTHSHLIAQIEELDGRLYKWMHFFHNLTATGPVYVRRMLVVHNVAANILLDELKSQTQYYTFVDNIEEQERQRHREEDSPECAGRCRFKYTVNEVEDLLKYEPFVTAVSRRKRPPSLGFIPPIYLVAISAPKVATRLRAITALKQLKTSEGPWNTDHAAKIAEAMLEIANDCAVPPGSVELRHMTFQLDEPRQCLSIEWEPEDPVLQTMAVMKRVEVAGLDWKNRVSHDLHLDVTLEFTSLTFVWLGDSRAVQTIRLSISFPLMTKGPPLQAPYSI